MGYAPLFPATGRLRLLGATRPQTPRQEAAAGLLHLAAGAAPLDPKFDAFPCGTSTLHALWLGNLEALIPNSGEDLRIVILSEGCSRSEGSLILISKEMLRCGSA